MAAMISCSACRSTSVTKSLRPLLETSSESSRLRLRVITRAARRAARIPMLTSGCWGTVLEVASRGRAGSRAARRISEPPATAVPRAHPLRPRRNPPPRQHRGRRACPAHDGLRRAVAGVTRRLPARRGDRARLGRRRPAAEGPRRRFAARGGRRLRPRLRHERPAAHRLLLAGADAARGRTARAPAAADGTAAVVFGTERTGLSNEDLELCGGLVRIPANPAFESLNLAQAVQVLAYELRCAAGVPPAPPAREVPLAPAAELERLNAHLAEVLVEVGFTDRLGGPHLSRRLARIFGRAELDQHEVNILRGFLAAVQARRRRAGSG